MTTWFTADPHFGHDNIIKYSKRPFNSINHMDAVLLENLWARVGPKDVLWILGDFAFGRGSREIERLQSIFDQLPGAEKHLVIGNHDNEATLQLPWTSVSHMAEARCQNRPNPVLCHYPMLTWNRARKNALQLFGHVHNRWLGSRNSINVGVDVWGYSPVTLRDIENRAKTLPINKYWSDVEHGAELSVET